MEGKKIPEMNKWIRLLTYREELIEVCEDVAVNLEKNRSEREEWHNLNVVWKKNWLGKE